MNDIEKKKKLPDIYIYLCKSSCGLQVAKYLCQYFKEDISHLHTMSFFFVLFFFSRSKHYIEKKRKINSFREAKVFFYR